MVESGKKGRSEMCLFPGDLLCARDAALAHPDNKLSGPPEKRHRRSCGRQGLRRLPKRQEGTVSRHTRVTFDGYPFRLVYQ